MGLKEKGHFKLRARLEEKDDKLRPLENTDWHSKGVEKVIMYAELSKRGFKIFKVTI